MQPDHAMTRSFQFCVVIQLLSAALRLHLAAGQPSSSQTLVCSVDAQDPGSLVQCLEDSRASEVVIKSDYSVQNSFVGYTTTPLQLTRNVTIRGPAARHPDDWPVLDFGMLDGVIQLCSGCIVTLNRLVLKGERKGSGPVYDVFVGQPGPISAQVRSIATLRLRSACTPPSAQMKAIKAMPRSSILPNRTAPQGVMLQDVTYKGKVYKDTVVAPDLTFDVGYKFDEGSSSDEGGFAQVARNSSRLCEHYVDPACLAAMDADACVQQLVDALNARTNPSGMARAAAVAIAVPLALGFLLAAGFLAWRVGRHRLQRSSKECSVDLLKPHSSAQLLRTRTSGTTSTSGSGSFDHPGSGGLCLGKPQGHTTGWEVMDSRTAPSLEHVENQAIELGAFIGAGSFGKVFKGTWNGMQVAVKVIEHSGTSADAVETEMETLMSFQHDNIVRAYYCMTYVHADAPLDHECSDSGISIHNSGGRYGPNSFTAGSFAFATAAAASNTSTPALGRYSGRGTPSGQRTGSAEDMHPAGHGAAAATITQRVPLTPAAEGAAAAVTAPSAPRVRFEQPESAQQGSCFAAGSGGSGSGNRAFSDSAGSSLDCKCFAAEIQRSKSSGSQKEASKRFESWLVQEYCDKGAMCHYLEQWPAPCKDENGAGSLLRVLQLLRDAAQGLQELHSHKVVHGDLNARNVLVASCSSVPAGVTAKLADLGLSRSIKQHATHRTTNTIGTMSHMPPEMLRSGQMSVSADTYALGIMMWELYTGENAFHSLQHPGQFFETVVLQDLRPVIPQGMPADYQLLMQRCWATQPSARPSISHVLECLNHMIGQHQQQLRKGYSTQAADAPGHAVARSALLAGPPPGKQHWWHGQQAQPAPFAGSRAPPSQMSAALPGAASPHSNSLLPAINVEHPKSSSSMRDAAQPLNQSLPAHQQQPAHVRQQHQQPAAQFGPRSGPFSFFRSSSGRRQTDEVPDGGGQGTEGSRVGREWSGSTRDRSSGKLPTFCQYLGASMRQGSLTLREMSFNSRGGSWSTGHDDDLRSGRMGDHVWFV